MSISQLILIDLIVFWTAPEIFMPGTVNGLHFVSLAASLTTYIRWARYQIENQHKLPICWDEEIYTYDKNRPPPPRCPNHDMKLVINEHWKQARDREKAETRPETKEMEKLLSVWWRQFEMKRMARSP